MIGHEFRLAKTRLRLERLLLGEQKIADQRGEIEMPRRRPLFERRARNSGELGQRKVFPFPSPQNRVPEFSEKWIHPRTISSRLPRAQGAFTMPACLKNVTAHSEYSFSRNTAARGRVENLENDLAFFSPQRRLLKNPPDSQESDSDF